MMLDLHILLEKLNYSFKKKPIIVGGKAMEYYGLRKAGRDIDLIASKEDMLELIKLYPERLKDLSGDLGVCPFDFEIWRTIAYFDYEHYRRNSVEEENYLIVSLEDLLFMKAMAYKNEKYLNDLKLIIDHITGVQFKKYYEQLATNNKLLRGIKGIKYVEKTS